MSKNDIEELFRFKIDHINIRTLLSNIDVNVLTNYVLDISKIQFNGRKTYDKLIKPTNIKHKIKPKNAQVSYIYRKLLGQHKLNRNESLENCLITKKSRSLSGVLVITVVTSPGEFSCIHDCYFCPNEPGQPRSYLKNEPAVRRANKNDFDIEKQFHERACTHSINGHPVDKIEVIVEGGTWSNYSLEYQYDCIRDIYYAANTFYDPLGPKRAKLSLKEEKTLNETGLVKIIGLTLETRPDYINTEEICRYLDFGVTRVQLGIQTTKDDILKKINRGCYSKDSKLAIKLLLEAGMKIIIHIMPNLPYSSPETDVSVFDEILYSKNYCVDEWKIYPTSVTADPECNSTFTVIEKWYKDGKYQPYSMDILKDIIVHAKERVPPYVRIARIFRDFPMQYIIGGADRPNLRQDLHKMMAEKGTICDCIRCSEVRDRISPIDKAKIVVRKHEASGGDEYFITYESEENSERFLHGFLRLRLSKDAGMSITHLQNHALIRELHVYGQVIPTLVGNKDTRNASQHQGIGKMLLKKAEAIAYQNNFSMVAIRSGVGVRDYYRKRGYILADEYMRKDIVNYKIIILGIICIYLFLLYVIVSVLH